MLREHVRLFVDLLVCKSAHLALTTPSFRRLDRLPLTFEPTNSI